MTAIRVLIAAAGRGSRAGVPYPKALQPVLGRPILVRQIELLRSIDPRPTVIVNPQARPAIMECLLDHHLDADLVEQDTPTGMGDAVVCFRKARSAQTADHLLLVWGDIPLLQWRTVRELRRSHLAHANDFTFVSSWVQSAYTLVTRRPDGSVDGVEETRETGRRPGPGERDIGVFLFRAAPVLSLLGQRLPGALGRTTREHGFLYVVRHLVDRGYRVEALPIASPSDLISFNQLSDLDAVYDVSPSRSTT